MVDIRVLKVLNAVGIVSDDNLAASEAAQRAKAEAAKTAAAEAAATKVAAAKAAEEAQKPAGEKMASCTRDFQEYRRGKEGTQIHLGELRGNENFAGCQNIPQLVQGHNKGIA